MHIYININIHNYDYGIIDTNTSMGKMHLRHYISRCSFDKEIKVQFTSLIPWELKTTTIRFTNEVFAGIHEVYYPSKIQYTNIDGIIFCDLTRAHRTYASSDMFGESDEYNRLLVLTRTAIQNRDNRALIISDILPQSTCIDEDMISACDFAIVRKVNGQYISTVEELNKIINKYVKLNTSHNRKDQANTIVMLELENNNILSLHINSNNNTE